MSEVSVLALARRSKQLFPHSAHCRRQWVKQTAELYRTDKHMLSAGQWPKRGEMR